MSKKNVEVSIFGDYRTWRDDSFEAADSPVTIDFTDDTDGIGAVAAKGLIRVGGNSKTGSVDVQLFIAKNDTVTSYKMRVDEDETFDFSDSHVKGITITHTGTDARYRIFAQAAE